MNIVERLLPRIGRPLVNTAIVVGLLAFIVFSLEF
jgi:hypothetical protein